MSKLATRDDFANMDADTLRDEAAKCLIDIAGNLKRLSLICVELENRGEDFGDFQIILPGGVHRSIAEGQMLPETFTKLGARRALMNTVAALPPSEQKRLLVDAEPIEVAERSLDGKITHRLYPVERLPTSLMKQVFDYRRIRPREEQEKLPPEPVNAVRVHPADFTATVSQAEALIVTIRDGGRIAKKKAAKQLCEVAGKLAGFLIS